jgi:hypothetical protein
MSPRAMLVCMAALITAGLGAPGGASGEPPSTIPVTGCLEQTRGGFTLVDATPSPGQLEPETARPLGRTGIWRLETTEDLGAYVHHRIEVTGHPIRTPGKPSGGRRAAGGFAVESIAKVGEACSP